MFISLVNWSHNNKRLCVSLEKQLKVVGHKPYLNHHIKRNDREWTVDLYKQAIDDLWSVSATDTKTYINFGTNRHQ